MAKEASWSNPAHCVSFSRNKHRDVGRYLEQFYSAAGGYQNTEGETVYLAKIRWFNYGVGENGEGALEAHPNEVWYRESFDQGEPWKKISLRRGQSVSHPRPLSDARFDLYDEPLTINRLKAKDLHDLARKFLAAKHHDLYPPPPEEESTSGESSSSSDSSSSDDAEEKTAALKQAQPRARVVLDIADVDSNSMIVYDLDEDRIAIGQVLAVDEKQKMLEVHRFDSYSKSRKLRGVSTIKFAAVYNDPKDGKHVYTGTPKKSFEAVTDYVVPSEVRAQNFKLENGHVPITVAKSSGLFAN